jgi:hypothetical protein
MWCFATQNSLERSLHARRYARLVTQLQQSSWVDMCTAVKSLIGADASIGSFNETQIALPLVRNSFATLYGSVFRGGQRVSARMGGNNNRGLGQSDSNHPMQIIETRACVERAIPDLGALCNELAVVYQQPVCGVMTLDSAAASVSVPFAWAATARVVDDALAIDASRLRNASDGGRVDNGTT